MFSKDLTKRFNHKTVGLVFIIFGIVMNQHIMLLYVKGHIIPGLSGSIKAKSVNLVYRLFV